MSKLSVSQFKNTPSGKYISQDLEFKIRKECCLLIKKSGIVLNLKVQTCNTAQILLQKYYYVQRITKNKILSVIIGVLFISTKVEEDPKSLKEIIKVVDFLHKGVKEGIEGIELEILITVGFNVSVVQPHSFLLNILNSLGLVSKKNVVQATINYLNDALLTHVYLVYSPVTIATGCIYLCSMNLKIKLYRKWYLLFDVCLKDLQDFSLVMMDLYNSSTIPICFTSLIDQL